jgi:hypothetical protein
MDCKSVLVKNNFKKAQTFWNKTKTISIN